MGNRLHPVVAIILTCFTASSAAGGVADPIRVVGPKKLLVIAVSFSATSPGVTRESVWDKATRLDRYIRAASYDQAWLEPKVVGWYRLPGPLDEYKVSPYNFKVDRQRVRRLLAEAVDAARRDADASAHDVVWIVVGVQTRPGEGYGMIAYAANPGMLSGVRASRGKAARMELVTLPGGGAFTGAAIVSAENAHLGHVAHDLLHALGGVKDGRRVVPDLYDFELQSDPRVPHTSPLPFATHAGPWDIMSLHFIERGKWPPPPSSFTRLQLGWIRPEQAVTVLPGETRELTVQPLAQGRGILVARIPTGGSRYTLLENRQSLDGDAVLPSAGLVVLEVDTEKEEGSGIVRAADANPGTPHLFRAPFLPQSGERRYYENRRDGIAVVPLATEPNKAMRIVVTTPERAAEFVK